MTNSHDRRTMQYGLVVFNSGIGMVRPLTLYRFTRSAVWNMIFISKKFIIILTIVTLLNIYIMNNIYIYIFCDCLKQGNMWLFWNPTRTDRGSEFPTLPDPAPHPKLTYIFDIRRADQARKKKNMRAGLDPPPQPGGSKIFLFGGIRYRILA